MQCEKETLLFHVRQTSLLAEAILFVRHLLAEVRFWTDMHCRQETCDPESMTESQARTIPASV